MKIEQRQWTTGELGKTIETELGNEAHLVLVFGERSLLKKGGILREIKRMYPKAHLFGSSTSGEIYNDRVYDDTVCTTAIHFERTKIKLASLPLVSAQDSFDVGKQLASSLDSHELVHVLVLSVGLKVNGSELVKGMASGLPAGVNVTGGLAGDQARFTETLVLADGVVSNQSVTVVALYGQHIRVKSASLGGWDAFGPERLITKSEGNILFELDNRSALQLYKEYLGEQAKDLPGSALLFPLCVRIKDSEVGVVRTILAIDEKTQGMVFAGDVPEGAYARFMKANFDRLIDGAIGAAEKSMFVEKEPPELAILISCVGRKIVLKQRIDEEVEGVRSIFGSKTVLTGFYSYGEISPFTPSAKCELHNQTMTITTLSEIDGKIS
jgi:hypothetical protein